MKKRINVTEAWKALAPEIILAIARVSGTDGHSVFKPEAYQQAGMPAELLAHFTVKIVSDQSDPKYMVYGHDGNVIPELTGVYGLNVVESICNAFDLQPGSYLGRGFRAQAAYRAIREKFGTLCECADGKCPVHTGHDCTALSTCTLYRSDMDDKSGVRFCEACAADAMESGVFTDRAPQSEASAS